MKQFTSIFATLILLIAFLSTSAKVWRLNNNIGASADFTNFNAAVSSTSVLDGDTLHIEASATGYGAATINKKLTIIGPGYFLDPSNTTTPANPGLQYKPQNGWVSSVNFVAGSSGTKFIGVSFGGGSLYGDLLTNITLEKCLINQDVNFYNNGNTNVTIRKCFIYGAGINCTSGSLSNFTFENNIVYEYWGKVNLPSLTGSNNIFRNNSFYANVATSAISNCYVANNIFYNSGGTPVNFINCNIKNNIFSQNQTFTNNIESGNSINVNMATVYTLGTSNSLDSRMVLKAGSPAIGYGVTVGVVTNPDCGAFGATDPYKLSGIPSIPTIYNIVAPSSILSGAGTMNVTFSTRNNN